MDIITYKILEKMPEKGIRSTYSQSPFQIFMNDDNGVISTGTGFFYSSNAELFLITNWHNISGRHFLTKEKLSPRSPTYLQLKLATYLENSTFFTAQTHRVEIYEDYKPMWYEHPILGSSCDVIALPIEKPSGCPEFMHYATNLISKMRIPVIPGNPVFIIGFPKSISVGFGLPLWKSGFIASEPNYDITIGGEIADMGGLQNGEILPAFFIDSQTREGMSGSPVFASYTGNWNMTDPYKPIDPQEGDFWSRDDIALGENRMEFVGCYSGRIGKIEEGAALGICWREDVIKRICDSKKIAVHPHVS